MAIIYGMADSERSLLDKLPNEVRDVDDMGRVKKEFEAKIENTGVWIFQWNSKMELQKTSR